MKHGMKSHSSGKGEEKRFSHLKGYYPHDGQTCDPEGYSPRVGEIEGVPGAYPSMAGPDGYHETAGSNFGMGPHSGATPELGGAALGSTPAEPTRGEGSQGPAEYPHAGAPERTTSVGQQGVQHHPSGKLPRGGAHS